MARFETIGMDDLISSLDMMGQTTGELAEKMLFAGAEEIRKAWRKAARLHGLIDTGEMIDSIGYSRKVKRAQDILSVDIYPMGKSKTTTKDGKHFTRGKPVRNAEKAFVLHYGSSKLPATHWVDTADDISGPEVENVCRELYEKWLEDNGYI